MRHLIFLILSCGGAMPQAAPDLACDGPEVYPACGPDGDCPDGSLCYQAIGANVCAPACAEWACLDPCPPETARCTLSGLCIVPCKGNEDCAPGQVCRSDGDVSPLACVWPQ